MKLCLVIVENRVELHQTVIDNHFPYLPDGTEIKVYEEPESSTIQGYNRIMVSPDFWHSLLHYDRVLIAQHDSALLRTGIGEFYQYDYIGSPWKFQGHGGNGGLSLRNPKVMLDICNTYPYRGEQESGNEDIWFCNIMKSKNVGHLAPPDACRKFAVESIFSLGTVGYHAIDKYLAPEECEQIRKQYITNQKTPTPMNLEQMYNKIVIEPSDIFKHLPTLKKYSEQSKVVVELGVRTGLSTIALLMGRPQKLYSYDIKKYPEIDSIIHMAKEAGLDFTFTEANDLEIEIPECDMLWIDSYHVAPQLSKELSLHAGKARHFIAFHDTFTFWEQGEQPYTEVAGKGLDSQQGLKYAIEPFLQQHPNWVLEYRTDENNGLLVLRNVNYNENPEPKIEPKVEDGAIPLKVVGDEESDIAVELTKVINGIHEVEQKEAKAWRDEEFKKKAKMGMYVATSLIGAIISFKLDGDPEEIEEAQVIDKVINVGTTEYLVLLKDRESIKSVQVSDILKVIRFTK